MITLAIHHDFVVQRTSECIALYIQERDRAFPVHIYPGELLPILCTTYTKLHRVMVCGQI